MTASPEAAARALQEMQNIDVLSLAKQLKVPTLVLHCRGDMRVPFEEGRKLASAIAGARFVPLESRNHVLLPDEPAWTVFHTELATFVGHQKTHLHSVAVAAGLTPAERAILQLLSEGHDNQAIAERLGKSGKTVRNQLSVIFQKLGVKSRAQAMLAALDAKPRD
jgi:DNA-binding NarL/FixJ family response regulator